jgi:hypothetical protein
MLRGDRYTLESLLLHDSGRGLMLPVDCRGEWRLDTTWWAKWLVGQRVHVIGVRDGFDLLALEQMWRAGKSRPRGAAWPAALRRKLFG